MALRRFNLDLAIPLDANGKLPPVFHKKLNEALTSIELQALSGMEVIEIIKRMIRWLQKYSVKINEGKDSEEMTTRAVHHLCRHDVGLPCEAEEEV